ncbi:DNA alkylation repair protein [Streptomyces bambusae]|uniref:DNA alkylation repair protein n=1 Tax=Streptomyces bambusae TaxID=1550616 RepID=UPI001CFE2CAF|nr:DNA alkylation repair protein [Streptomyces bambusae]MCB5167732.1 DNA alkylation repair protein [Streptomyces bambusae]
MGTGDVAEGLREALRAHEDAAVGEQQRAYVKSGIGHLGVRVPEVRRCVTAVRRELGGLGAAEVRQLVRELWEVPAGGAEPVFEFRLAAVELLVQYVKVLDAGDLAEVEGLLRECRTWALVDPLAVHCAGAVALADPAAGPVLDRWIADEDFWLRRSAVLALLPGIRARRPDTGRLTWYADALVGEREFFLRKALGWVLREMSTREPEFVTSWLARHGDRVAPLTRREALRRLNAAGPSD